MQAGTDLDAIAAIQGGGQLLGIVSVCRDADQSHPLGNIGRPVNRNLLDRPQPDAQPFHQRQFVLTNGLHAALDKVIHAGPQGHDPGDVQVSCFETLRQRVGLTILLAFGPGATLSHAVKLSIGAGPHVENPGTQRTQQSLVARRGQQIGLQLADREGEMTNRLGGIDQEKSGMPLEGLGDCGDRLQGARHVGGVGDGHQFRVGSQLGGHGVGRDPAAGIAAHAGDLHPGCLFQEPQGAEHRVMFGIGGHDMIVLSEQAVDGEVECIGAVERKNDASCVVAAQQAGDAASDLVHRTFGLDRVAVRAASGGGTTLAQVSIAGRIDRFRFRPASCRVVQVDAPHLLPLVPSHPPI